RYSDTTAGVAIAQDPAAGPRVASDSSVRVGLRARPPPVRGPGVVGRSSASAKSRLANAGLRYGVTLVAAPGSEPNVVTRQSPRGAARVARGSAGAASR